MKEVWSQVLAKAERSRCEMSVGPVEEACGRRTVMKVTQHTTEMANLTRTSYRNGESKHQEKKT